jgi:Cu(I)/Ag(I) efflux system membrane fusion protein
LSLLLSNTIRGEYKSIPVTKELLGIVTYDTRSIYVIPARIGGRLEKVYLKYNFQPVTKGMKIAEVYSPELISAQRELVYLIQNDTDNKLLIDGAISRLKFLGATEKQVAELIENQKVNTTFSIYCPYDGYVTADEQSPALQSSPVAASVSSSGAMGMNSAKVSGNQPSVNVSSASLPREGSYVDTGQTLFKIVSANATWIEFELPSTDAESIKKGAEIVLAVENESMKAKVDFIEPFTEQSKDFVRIRSYNKNSKLLIGQLVKGAVSLTGKSSLWLPKSAVLDLGMERVIFIKEQDQFRPKKVEVGFQANGSIEIISGLTSGDEVAMDAHYLMDSEGFIKVTK